MSAMPPGVNAAGQRIFRLGTLVEISVEIPEEGMEGHLLDAYMTDEVDTWGKRTFYVVQDDGDLSRWYLFPHEYEVQETYTQEVA